MTTAASIWSVAALGLAAGGGLYFAAGLSTVIILVILAGIKPLEEAYRARIQSCEFEMLAERAALSVDEIKTVLHVRGRQIRRVLTAPAEDGLDRTTISLIRVSDADIRAGAAQLRKQPGVHSVKVRRRRRAVDQAGHEDGAAAS